MSRTFAAAAPGLPVLRSTALPELEGTALRLHVAPVMTAIWSDGPRGYALLSLCPGDDPDEPAALVRLPLMQCEALERATAAFNCIMSAADREMTLDQTEGHSAKGTHNVRTPGAGRDSTASFAATAAAQVAVPTMILQRESTPPPAHSPHGTASRAQVIATAAAQVLVLAAFLPAVVGRVFGLI